MKRTPLACTILIALHTVLFASAFPPASYSEYTLENGTSVFVLEDFSSATIHIEYAVKAGISSQNKDTTGFFTLYSRLFKYAAPENSAGLPALSAECNADSSRYRMTVSPAQFSSAMTYLSKAAFNPVFTDNSLSKELSSLKAEVQQQAQFPSTFINSGIDSRVFSAAPWKHDSGVYPAIFTRTTVEQARSILRGISQNWYTPQNSAVFITGSIKKQDALKVAKETFGAYREASFSEHIIPVKAGGEKHKFVLVSKDFSSEITQAVVQFTSLSMTQCDISAAAYNADGSSVKKLLLKQRNLAIRDGEYIHAAAAHKSGSSRLIFQTIMEKPVNKKVTLADQAELLISKIKEGVKNTGSDEYAAAKKTISESFSAVTSNPVSYMDYLSQFWATEQLNGNGTQGSTRLSERMENRPRDVAAENIKNIQQPVDSEQPFVFILLNDDVYRKNRQSFKKLGYEEITVKNSAWYTREFSSAEEELADGQDYEAEEEQPDFISRNRNSIKTFTLENGIPVTVKNTSSTSNVLILVAIDGGTLYSPRTNGFEKVKTNAFASNVQKEINKYRINQVLESEPEVLSETFASYSAITVECAKEDAAICLKCISDALIFGEIAPAEADSYVYTVQTQKRLYNASAVNQLYYQGIRFLYEDKAYRAAFDSENDILQDTQYADILAAYPQFLDAALYSLVIVGNIDEDYLKEPLKNTFGLLSKKNEGGVLHLPKTPDFPENRSISVKLRHLFYTDVKAEDAGPMPAILIPTTNFSDPVQYWLKAPPPESSNSVLFDALVWRLAEILEENADGVCSGIKIAPQTREVQGAAVTFLTADHTSKVFELFEKSAGELLERLSGSVAEEEVQAVRSSWILNALQKTAENRGTAILIRNGGKNPAQYLDDYQMVMQASEEEYRLCAEAFIPKTAPLRLYSADAKK